MIARRAISDSARSYGCVLLCGSSMKKDREFGGFKGNHHVFVRPARLNKALDLAQSFFRGRCSWTPNVSEAMPGMRSQCDADQRHAWCPGAFRLKRKVQEISYRSSFFQNIQNPLSWEKRLRGAFAAKKSNISHLARLSFRKYRSMKLTEASQQKNWKN